MWSLVALPGLKASAPARRVRAHGREPRLASPSLALASQGNRVWAKARSTGTCTCTYARARADRHGTGRRGRGGKGIGSPVPSPGEEPRPTIPVHAGRVDSCQVLQDQGRPWPRGPGRGCLLARHSTAAGARNALKSRSAEEFTALHEQGGWSMVTARAWREPQTPGKHRTTPQNMYRYPSTS